MENNFENLNKGLRSLLALVAICLLSLLVRNTVHAADHNKATDPMVNPAVTADNQSMDENDMEITRKIRERIMQDKTLSVSAQNIKIITRNGRVVLKGPVITPAEKTSVGNIASSIAGTAQVQNNTTISR